ncbi:MAG: hypothetical protein ACE5KI_08045, partial [Dehalococcoidia bacterium]
SLVLDENENPIIVYSDQSIIKLAYLKDFPHWQIETVATAGDVPFGQLVSLEIDSDGVLHLAYTEVESRTSPGISGAVKYARGTPIN